MPTTHACTNHHLPSDNPYPPQITGTLDLKLRVDGVSSSGVLDLKSRCGFPLLPRMRVVLPQGSGEVLAVVWKDNLNR